MNNINDKLFLGRLSEMLSDLIESQSAEVFDRVGLIIPVKSCSLMRTIEELEPVSAADLAQTLASSHQLVLQKTPKLIKLGLIVRVPCPDDLRRKLFSLTHKGRKQLDTLRTLEPKFVAIYEDLGEGVGDLHTMLLETIRTLQKRSMAERIN